MSDEIGELYNTAIPTLSETADIQEAFRIYHYGAPSGSAPGEYPINNTEPSNLVNPSIAYHLNSLQQQITDFNPGILATAWTGKGTLISASDIATPYVLDPGSNGNILRVNTSATAGIEWAPPEVSIINTVTLSNKTMAASFIEHPGITFLAQSGNEFTLSFGTDTLTANRNISLPDATGKVITTGNLQDIVGQLNPTAPFTIKNSSNQVIMEVVSSTNGNIEIGRKTGGSSTPYIDFHSGATETDYDSRIIASGGNGVVGGGTLQVVGNLVNNVNTTAKSGAYTLQPADYNTVVQMNSAAAFNLSSSISGAPVGTQITLLALVSGVTVTSVSPIILNATPGRKLRAPYSIATLMCIASNTWVMTGDLSV